VPIPFPKRWWVVGKPCHVEPMNLNSRVLHVTPSYVLLLDPEETHHLD
jgi:hypothetical protein